MDLHCFFGFQHTCSLVLLLSEHPTCLLCHMGLSCLLKSPMGSKAVARPLLSTNCWDFGPSMRKQAPPRLSTQGPLWRGWAAPYCLCLPRSPRCLLCTGPSISAGACGDGGENRKGADFVYSHFTVFQHYILPGFLLVPENEETHRALSALARFPHGHSWNWRRDE